MASANTDIAACCAAVSAGRKAVAGAQVLFPIISRRNEQNQGVRKVAFQSMAVLMLFAGLIALPIIIFSHQILTLWVGDVIADEAGKVLSWLALGFALLAINNVPHFVLLGLNKAQSVAWCNIAAGLLAVGISYVLIPTIGLQGAAWGRLGYAIVISLLIALMNRALRQSS